MGFFSDLKEDLSQAVNELLPEEQGIRDGGKTEEKEISLDEMLKNIDDIRLEEEEEAEPEELEPETAGEADSPAEPAFGEQKGLWEEESAEDGSADDEMEKMLEKMLAESTADDQREEAPKMPETPVIPEAPVLPETPAMTEVLEVEEVPAETILDESKGAEKKMDMATVREAVDETSVITGGMTITGDILSEGSIDILGTVNGNIDILGKLNITGHVNGNSKAAEIYAEGAKINGEVVSEGAIKIGASSVIIGNISATSAAIAGAVKGDIDVRGPVILDASAIVMGNIKSKSVQINNGAVIEGMCSQCYADVSPTSFFEDYKPEIRKPRSK